MVSYGNNMAIARVFGLFSRHEDTTKKNFQSSDSIHISVDYVGKQLSERKRSDDVLIKYSLMGSPSFTFFIIMKIDTLGINGCKCELN